jgi:hypothetical protein
VCLAFVFVRFTSLHEVLSFKLGFNTYLLYILGILATGALVMGGGIRRTLQWNPSRYWMAFGIWLAIGVPFSFWPGGSLSIVTGYWRTELLVLFVIAGLIVTWDEVWNLLGVLGLAAVTTIMVSKSLDSTIMDRTTLAFGSISDPNDLAAHLVLMMPLLLMVVVTPNRNVVLRFAALSAGMYGLYLVLSTGSRGAMIALVAMLVGVIYMLPARYKVPVGLLMVMTGSGLVAVVPSSVTGRFGTLLGMSDSSDEVRMAEGSTEGRTYLLQKSLLYTLKHPIFGVGAGEFADYEGAEARESQQRGTWHETHNAYTQVSSEGGLPTLLFLLAALYTTFGLLRKTVAKAKVLPDTLTNRRIQLAASSLTISLLGFSAAIFFLSLGYRYYMPAFTGLAIALHRAAQLEWAKRPEVQPTVQPNSPGIVKRDSSARIKLGGRILTGASSQQRRIS